MALAAIALGSNLGDREHTLRCAVVDLAELGTVLAVSPLLDTTPVGYTDQPRFLNGAVLLQTSLAPLDLLHRLLQLEQRHGRDRNHSIAKGPRTLDLDLLLYDDFVSTAVEMTLPHPEMHRRAFVLEPLAAVLPGWHHPLLGLTVAQMLAGLQ